MKYLYAQIYGGARDPYYVTAIDTTDFTYNKLIADVMTKRYLVPLIGELVPNDEPVCLIQTVGYRVKMISIYPNRSKAEEDISGINTSKNAEDIVKEYYGIEIVPVVMMEVDEENEIFDG